MNRFLFLIAYTCFISAVLAGTNHRPILAVALALPLGVFAVYAWICGLLLLEDTPRESKQETPANPSFELYQDYLEARRKIDEIGHSFNYLFNHSDDRIWDDDQYRPGPEAGPEKR